MMSIFEKLLRFYNFTDKDYEDFVGFIDDSSFPRIVDENSFNMIKKLKECIESGKKIIISGDYDCDGITSTSILFLTIKKLNENVGYFIPSRYKEGYGLNIERIAQFKEKGYDVLISVDNGITCVEEVKYAKSLGFDVIIVDHHEVQEVIPPADYIFHQKLSHLTDYNISAAFLALLISNELLGYYDPYLVSLAGLAVLSDSMPLEKANLALLRMALKYINEYKYEQIVDIANTDIYDEIFLNFNVIPKINAVGRVETGLKVNDVVKLFTSDNSFNIKQYAFELECANDKRRSLVASYDKEDLVDYKSFYLYDSKLILGVGGLLANRILTMQKNNAVVMNLIDDEYTCSARTLPGYDIMLVLSGIKDKLTHFGGHSNAAGFSFKKEQLNEILKYLADNLKPNTIEEKRSVIDIELSDVSSKTFDMIKKFGPFGQNHSEPLFHICVDNSSFKRMKLGSEHIYIQSNDVKIIFFNGLSKLSNQNETRLIGKFAENTFNKRKSIQFIVESTVEESDYILI